MTQQLHTFQHGCKGAVFIVVVLVRYTEEAHIKEPAFIRNSRLKFQPLSHLNRNHKEAGQG